MRERFVNQIYLGRTYQWNQPVFVPLSKLLKGAIIFGSPGTGKSVKLACLVRQIIRSGRASVSVFNLKPLTNDLLGVMLHEVETLRQRENQKEPGKRRPLPLWLYSMRPGRSSHLLNAFAGEAWANFTPGQQAQVLMMAMAFSHTRSFEQAFFNDSARRVLEHTLESARDRGEIVTTFGRLHELLKVVLNPRYKGLSEHVKTYGAHPSYIVERLAKLESLGKEGQAPQVLEAGIDLERFVREPCFAYYDLDPFIDPETAGEVTRLALQSFFSRISNVRRSVPHVIFIDEFSLVIADSLAQLFRQARETNCGLILATQSVADLQQGSTDLTNTIFNSTQVQFFMRISDAAGIRLLQEFAGKRREHSLSVTRSENRRGEPRISASLTETLVDRINMGEIELVNSERDLEFVRIIGNDSTARFNSALFVNRWDYDRTYEEYKAFCNAPWPEAQSGMIVVGKRGPALPGVPDDDYDRDWQPEELGQEPLPIHTHNQKNSRD